MEEEIIKANKIWNNLDIEDKEKFDGFETEFCPMCPNLYFQLSNISGINKLNGITYQDYVNSWKNRRKIK